MSSGRWESSPPGPAPRQDPGVPVPAARPRRTARPHRLHVDQHSDRVVRVAGSRFVPSDGYPVKADGARRIGYRTVSIAGAREPILIAKVDEIVEAVRGRVADNFAHVPADDYHLLCRRRMATPRRQQATRPPVLDRVGQYCCSITARTTLVTHSTGRDRSATPKIDASAPPGTTAVPEVAPTTITGSTTSNPAESSPAAYRTSAFRPSPSSEVARGAPTDREAELAA